MSPDPRERDLVKCEDMRIHAERAIQYMGSRSLDQFLGNDMAQSAVVRCIEVIGEAARLVSEDTRRHVPEIPWALIVGMRHVLAHHYGAVNLDKVYEVVKERLPALLPQLRVLISDLEKGVHWSDEGPE
jgi:uncharacterized protein with HEPN domain